MQRRSIHEASITGNVSCASGDAACEGWALVGATSSEYPDVHPAACSISRFPGSFQLSLPFGRYTVVAVGFPNGVSAERILLQQDLLRGKVQCVAPERGAATPPIQVVLRAPRASDLPITPSYAMLFQHRVSTGLT